MSVFREIDVEESYTRSSKTAWIVESPRDTLTAEEYARTALDDPAGTPAWREWCARQLARELHAELEAGVA